MLWPFWSGFSSGEGHSSSDFGKGITYMQRDIKGWWRCSVDTAQPYHVEWLLTIKGRRSLLVSSDINRWCRRSIPAGTWRYCGRQDHRGSGSEHEWAFLRKKHAVLFALTWY